MAVWSLYDIRWHYGQSAVNQRTCFHYITRLSEPSLAIIILHWACVCGRGRERWHPSLWGFSTRLRQQWFQRVADESLGLCTRRQRWWLLWASRQSIAPLQCTAVSVEERLLIVTHASRLCFPSKYWWLWGGRRFQRFAAWRQCGLYARSDAQSFSNASLSANAFITVAIMPDVVGGAIHAA